MASKNRNVLPDRLTPASPITLPGPVGRTNSLDLQTGKARSTNWRITYLRLSLIIDTIFHISSSLTRMICFSSLFTHFPQKSLECPLLCREKYLMYSGDIIPISCQQISVWDNFGHSPSRSVLKTKLFVLSSTSKGL